MASEKFEDTMTSYDDIDLSKVGDFGVFNEPMFYDSDEKLRYYEDNFNKDDAKVKKGSKKRKRGETEDLGDGGAAENPPEPAPKAKRGRPRKKPRIEGDDAPLPKKHEKQPRVEDNDVVPTPPKKHGRPQKQPRIEEDGDDASTPSKKRQRPHKQPIPEEGDGTATASAVPKRHGRAPKRNLDAERAGATDVGASMGEPMEGVDSILLPTPVQPVSTREASGLPLETPAVATDWQETVSATPHVTSEPLTASPKEVGRSFPKLSAYDLTSWVVSKGSDGSQLQAGADPHVQAAVPTLSDEQKGSPPPVTPAQIKRTRTSTPGDKLKTNKNISHLRRENEILLVIQDLGGIANLHTKDFFDAHIALLNNLAQRGEPASAPSGTRLDKRTADATVKNMESRGHIKMLKTTIFSATGSSRPACLLYLPDTPQEKINEFLHHLSHNTPVPHVLPIKMFEVPVDFGARSASQRAAPPEDKRRGNDDHEDGTDVAHAKDADEKASRKARAKQKR
ncbi:hypothetical protein M405DRAFT_870342, partial [Rhizopogon salebrosus TDB-379]